MDQHQIRVPFKKWDLIAWVNSQDGQARVAIKPICEAIGIAWQGQHEKIKDDPKFNCQDIVMVAEDGKQRSMVTLPVEEINGWLFGISSRKAKAEVAPLLLEFQKYCFKALYAAVSGQANTEVVADLMHRLDDAIAKIAWLTQEMMELRKENAEFKKMVVEPINTSVSNAARSLRGGHLKN
jgi:hypothetical protein